MNLFGLLCLLVSTVLVNGNVQSNDKTFATGQYLITYPQILSPTGNKVCLTLLDGFVPKNKDLIVTISDARNQTLDTQTFRIEKDSKCFALETKRINGQFVILSFKLDSDLFVTRMIPFEASYGMTMIETNKPVYQLGETLRFRVLSFDGSMKPLSNNFGSIALLDPENEKIMEWKEKSEEIGIKHYELDLAPNSKEGIWKIVGITKSGETVEKLFQVAKKIQSKVNLRITKGDKFILANEGDHRMVVCAEDNQGVQLNKGSVDVKVGRQLVIRDAAVEENGCVHFNLRNETFRWQNLVGKAVDGLIEYKNPVTGDYDYMKFYLPVVRAQAHFRVPSSSLVKNYFKPGLPYFGYLIVETPEYTSLPNTEVQICYRMTSKPWQFEDSQEKSCKTFTSSKNGLIQYVIPPVDRDIKQILIEATIPGVEEHQQIFYLHPWAEKTSASVSIKPILQVDSCNVRTPEATRFTVLMTRNGTALFDKLYLQSAGRVSSAQTQSIEIKPTPYVVESEMLIGQWPESAEVFSANIWQEVNAESEKHSIMNRVIVYGLDSNGKLISDSIAYLKDCLRDQSLMTVDVDKNNRISVDLKIPRESSCSIALGTSAERSRLTEQKIHKLAENFDGIFANTFEWDRCSLAQMERNRNQPLVVDFKNNWDTFKEMGLRAIHSKSDVEHKPCEWEVYDNEVLNKSLQGLLAVQHNLPYPEHIMTSLANSANMAQLNRLENSLITDLLYWGSSGNLQKFLKSLKPSDLAGKSEIAVHAICMDQVQGVRSYSVVKSLNVPLFYIVSDLPTTVYQDTTQNVSLYIKRSQSSMKESDCIPIELEFETSDSYEIVSADQSVCSCKLVSKVLLTIKPLKKGPLNLKVVARFSSSLEKECSSEIDSFEPRLAEFKTKVEVYEPRITLKKYELACKDKTLLASENNETIYAAQDLVNIFVKQTRDAKSIPANILEILSRFSGLANMLAQDEKKMPTPLSRMIQKEILKLYQELSLYKFAHGPFSFNPGMQRVPSVVATSLAYKSIAEVQDNLLPTSSADILTQSLDFIVRDMKLDGCFYPKLYDLILWPFDHIPTTKELTAYVAANLVDAKQTPKIVLKRALTCLTRLESEKSDYFTRAVIAFLHAKMGKIESSKKLIRELESELTSVQNLEERKIPGRFMPEVNKKGEYLRGLAYIVKAKIALNQTDSVQQQVEKLLGSHLSLEDPLVADAIVSAWSIISNGGRPIIAEINSKRLSIERFEMKKIESSEKQKSLKLGSSEQSCLILERVREIPMDKYERTFSGEPDDFEASWETKKGETPAVYIKRGFKILNDQQELDESCTRRSITICGNKHSDDSKACQRFVLTLPPNYSLDATRLDRIISARQTLIESYVTKDDRTELHVAPMRNACFKIPLTTRGTLLEKQPMAYIEKHVMFSEPTVASIEIQKECSVMHNRARRSAATQTNSSTSAAKANRSTNSQQVNNNQKKSYDSQEQQTYDQPAQAYEAPVKGYAPSYAPPAYAPPAYEAPAYQAPAYEPPVKGYAPPAYQAPAYEPPAYQAPAYEAPVKGYAPPAYAPPAYEAPAYQAPAYEPPAYQAPAYEAPVKGYAPPAYEPPAYQAPAYEAPVKGYAPPAYAPPAYAPPAYAPPAYEPPAYQAPAYEPPAYQAPAYEAPVKGYSPPAYAPPAYAPPAYEPPAYQAPAYEPPAYQAPAYEAPVKGYAPPAYAPPAYAPPAYEPPAYQAPAYEPPAYQAPAYEAPVKGYSPPPYAPPAYAPPAYEPPAYQAPAYEPPAYQAPAYEAPVKGYAPPAYEPPAYQAPAYEAPVKGYAPPAYAPPAYAPPAYAPPAYAPPAYEPPAYQAPAYEAPVKGYAPPAYAPPAYAPPAYAPPAYEAPAYQAPAYEAPAKGYSPPTYEAPAKGYPALPPPPAYAPPVYEAPAYRETQGRSTQLRYGNSFASNNGQQARNPANPQRGNSQNQQRGNQKSNLAATQSRAAQSAYWQQNQGLRSNRNAAQRQSFSGSKIVRYSGAASEVQPVLTKQACTLSKISDTCPDCRLQADANLVDKICANSTVLSTIKPTQISNKGLITCGKFDVVHSYGLNLTHIQNEPFTINEDCECDSLNYSYVILMSDLLIPAEPNTIQKPKALGRETTIIPATPSNVQNLATFYSSLCR